ncbi:MAG: hypothetical protein HUU49_02845 [Candidatus Buchananbacteria bacterium]|nr:hypothetical protein [Candidatus Buchananbacteria bacterium]
MASPARQLPEDLSTQPNNQATVSDNIISFDSAQRDRELSRQLKAIQLDAKRAASELIDQKITDNLSAVSQRYQDYTGQNPTEAIQRIVAGKSNIKDEISQGLSGAAEKMAPKLEQATVNALKQAKQKAESHASESDQKFLAELKTSAGRLEKLSSLEDGHLKNLRAYYEGLRLAYILRSDIAKDNFDGITFIFVLTLSIVKDLVIDVPSVTAETATVGIAAILTTLLKGIIGFAVSGFLFFFYFGRSSWTKRWLVRRFLGTIVIEITPWLSLIPSYTLMAIFLKLKMDKKNNERQKELEQVEKRNKKLKRQLDKAS